MARRKERKRNKLVLFAAEGHNATETLYLRDLISDTDGLTLKKAYGNETDPVGMVENLIASKETFGFDPDYGDLAFCFIDLDCNKGKEQQIRDAAELAAANSIHLIVSNPCFELWYICHFTSSPKNYTDSKDLLKDMSKYIKGYSKSKEGIYATTKDKIETAIKNAKNLEKRAIENGYAIHTADFSPTTEAYRIFLLIKEASRRMD